MFKKLKAYYMENIDTIAASMASLNGGDYRPFIER